MLAVVNTPGGAAPVAVREVPEPVPAANEAVVAVHAFSLNRGETRLFQVRPEGWRPGQDIAGIVVRQAADNSGPAAGSRVVCLTDWEGWAERAAVPSHRMAALPDNVSFADAASLPVAGLTALRTLRHGAPLLGKRVLITGAAGGVGNLAVQLAARSGARITAVVGNAERARVLDGLGAAEIVTDIDQAQGRFALILEAAGGAWLTAAIARVEAKGVVVIYGNSSGEPTPLNFRDFAEHQNARLQGFHYFTSEPEEKFGADLALLVSLVADGSLKPRIVEHHWHDIPVVGARLLGRRVAGKAIFRIPQTGQPEGKMTIKVGDKVPSVTIRHLTAEGVQAVSSDDYFKGKTVAIFGLPGAYTRTCSSRHLPGYVTNSDSLKAKGIEEIACVSVNDAFVMNAWGKEHNAGGKVTMLGDGSCELTQALGLTVDRTEAGMGIRSQRYSMVVKDGVVTELSIEPSGEYGISSAEAMLERR